MLLSAEHISKNYGMKTLLLGCKPLSERRRKDWRHWCEWDRQKHFAENLRGSGAG